MISFIKLSRQVSMKTAREKLRLHNRILTLKSWEALLRLFMHRCLRMKRWSKRKWQNRLDSSQKISQLSMMCKSVTRCRTLTVKSRRQRRRLNSRNIREIRTKNSNYKKSKKRIPSSQKRNSSRAKGSSPPASPSWAANSMSQNPPKYNWDKFGLSSTRKRKTTSSKSLTMRMTWEMLKFWTPSAK